MQKNYVGLYLAPHTKINSEEINYLNVRNEAEKLLEKIRVNFHDSKLESFLDKIPNVPKKSSWIL